MSGNYETKFEGFSLNLLLPPSCVAFSPIYHDRLIIGTYFLEQQSDTNKDETKASEPQIRKGSLVLFRQTDGKL